MALLHHEETGSHVFFLHPAGELLTLHPPAPGTTASSQSVPCPARAGDIAWRVFDPGARARDGDCMHASAGLATGPISGAGALPCTYLQEHQNFRETAHVSYGKQRLDSPQRRPVSPLCLGFWEAAT